VGHGEPIDEDEDDNGRWGWCGCSGQDSRWLQHRWCCKGLQTALAV
jgi:hypothetical protein